MPEIVVDEGQTNLLPAEVLAGGGEESSVELSSGLFQRYELGKLLGYGAFAKVYHARDLKSGRSVAIKAVSKQRVLKGNLTAHVKREISIMRQLNHPHIVRLYEVLATKTKIYFVMEYAKGGELFAKVAKGRFSEDLSRKYFQQLISAISYCHAHGVFHRDLKPENLLLDENWDLKVTDFGLSAVTDQIRHDGMLHTLCGTPAYVAPEILAKRGYDGAKIDVWSCGVILYVLNAGYLPFNDPNLMVLYRKIYRGEFRCPKWTSPELKRFLTRILDPNPATRITVNEILNDPWFKKGYKEIKYPIDKEFELKDARDEEATRSLNAFDIISFSSGFDLSGMFDPGGNRLNSEMFIVEATPATVIGRIEEAVKVANVKVTKNEIGARLEGRDGNFTAVVEMYRLTEELAVVEVRWRAAPGRDLWKERVKPKLNPLMYRPEHQVAGN